jgi:hypothetical protein
MGLLVGVQLGLETIQAKPGAANMSGIHDLLLKTAEEEACDMDLN